MATSRITSIGLLALAVGFAVALVATSPEAASPRHASSLGDAVCVSGVPVASGPIAKQRSN